MKTIKKLFIISTLVGALLLSGCDVNINGGGNNNNNTPDSGDSGNNNNPSGGNDNNNQGSGDNNQQGGGDNNNTPSIPDTTIRIYATNDMHGQIYPEAGAGRVGIGKLMTYMKNVKDSDPNAFLIDSGDTWQGSIYSNYNYGACITDIMNYVHYDARTIGNHDFDWGVDKIKVNTAKEYNGYKTPVLGANIYDYYFDTKTVGTHQQSDLGVPSVTYTLANGVKVGIVGVIGHNQITSINSLYTREIAFIEHVNVIKTEARKLRNEGCQFVICSIHADQNEALGHNLKDYVDLVLCGHSHDQEYTNEGGLLFGQYGQYTEGIGYVELTYHASTRKVTFNEDTSTMYRYNEINNAVNTIDPTIQGIIDQYRAECDEAASEVIVKDVPYAFDNNNECSYMMAKAVYDTAKAEGYDIDCSYVNQPRHFLPSGEWTFADIYEAFPFNNVIYIIDVPATDYKREAWKYNWICKSSTESIPFNSTDTIKIACLDYLAFHTDADRYYDYFKSVVKYTDIDLVPHLQKNYREVLVDWLKDNDYNEDGHPLYDSDYSADYRQFNRMDLDCEMVNITYHLYDEVTQAGTGRYLFDFAADRIDNPLRDGYEFLGWYFDNAYTRPVNDDYEMKAAFDVYAKWEKLEPEYYYTDEMWMGYFPEDQNSNSVAAINCGHDLATINYTYSTITHDVQYYEFILGVDGYIHFEAPTGFVIYEFTVDIYKYDNLLFYNSMTRSDDTQILAVDLDMNQTENGHVVYHKTEMGLNELQVYNKYTGSGGCKIRYVKLTLKKLSNS